MFHKAQRYAPRVWTDFVMSRHVVIYCAMVLVTRLESTSSECRTLRTQSVPVRSAHRRAVHGVWVPGAALCLPSVAHAAVCRL